MYFNDIKAREKCGVSGQDLEYRYLFPLLPVNFGFGILNCCLLRVSIVIVSTREIVRTGDWDYNGELWR